MDNKAGPTAHEAVLKENGSVLHSFRCLLSPHLFASVVCSYTIEAIHTSIILGNRTKNVQAIQ